jgi:dienelactone hydrolase
MHRLALALVLVLGLAGCPSLDGFYRGRDAVDVAATDVPYANDDAPKHKLDVYRPKDAKQAYPVVVFVHGGYWRAGDKNYAQWLTGLYGNMGVALSELGVGGVITSYRLYPDAKLDDMLDDVVGAMKWTHDHIRDYGGDPDRIYLAGHSAGGHLVTLLGSRPELLQKRGFDPAWLKGVVGISGIYDIAANESLVEPDIKEVMLGLFKDPDAASPIKYFNKDMTPTLFLRGELDYPGVKHDYDLVELQLKSLVGDKVWFKMIPGNTHEDMVLELATPADEVGPAVAAFVRAGVPGAAAGFAGAIAGDDARLRRAVVDSRRGR